MDEGQQEQLAPAVAPDRARRQSAMLTSTRLACWKQEEAEAGPVDTLTRGSGRSCGRRGSSESPPPRTRRSRRSAGGGATRADGEGRLTAAAAAAAAAEAASRAAGVEGDALYGEYLCFGCGSCRTRPPAWTRPRLRWRPAEGRHQAGIEDAPVFRPTAEEFRDPVAYISSITPQAAKFGLAHIVPPQGWDPPFALEKGTNGSDMDSFRFGVRKQLTSHLCRRAAPPRASPRSVAAAAVAAGGRYAGKRSSGGGGGTAAAKGMLPAGAATGAGGDAEAAASPPQGADFGFIDLGRQHTLRSFAAYADWARAVHFTDPAPGEEPPEARAASQAAAGGNSRLLHPLGAALRPPSLADVAAVPGTREPTLEQMEAEFWRIVESPDGLVESLYGQDLDSGHHGSGFPLPAWRRRLLEAHLSSRGRRVELPQYADNAEQAWAEHAWNVGNMPLAHGSVLRYLTDDELITGVQVPWLYIGSWAAAFCWHLEDHGLYSVNYLHCGAPKIWYGVPAAASQALEEAMADALPHLVGASPKLLYQLVTMLSPTELKRRGVPVYRVVHEPGSFVVTMPGAYHAGFNCGFNVAEAVNWGPSHWLPYGTDVAEKYRRSGKPLTFSHDSLLVGLVQHGAPALRQGAAGAAAAAGPWQRQQAAAAEGGALGPRPWHHAPPEGVALACGELALRSREERARLAAGEAAAGLAPGALPVQRMEESAAPGSKDSAGLHVNTADCDCAVCNADLWLHAVISEAAPGVAVCPEHAAELARRHGALPASLRLLLRHSCDELDAMLAAAVERVPGAAQAVAAAAVRRERHEKERIRATPIGPMFRYVSEGVPAGALDIPPEALGPDDEGVEEGGVGCAGVAAKRGRGGGGKRGKSAGKGGAPQPRKRVRRGESARRREEALAKVAAKEAAEDVARDDSVAEAGYAQRQEQQASDADAPTGDPAEGDSIASEMEQLESLAEGSAPGGSAAAAAPAKDSSAAAATAEQTLQSDLQAVEGGREGETLLLSEEVAAAVSAGATLGSEAERRDLQERREALISHLADREAAAPEVFIPKPEDPGAEDELATERLEEAHALEGALPPGPQFL